MADYTPTIPSKRTVDFLYRGLIAFYPWTIFGEQKAKSMGYVKSWGGYDSSDFTLLVTNITKTEDVESGANVVLGWKRSWDKNAYPSATIPKNLDELVSDLDQTSKTKGKEAQITRLAKQSLLESEIAKEKDQIKIEKPFSEEKPQIPTKDLEKIADTSSGTKPIPTPSKGQATTKEAAGIVLQITKKVNLNPAGKLALSFAQLPFYLAGPSMANSSPSEHVAASAQNILFIQGVTSSTFKTAIKPRALALGISSSQIDKLITEISKQEKAFPGLFQTIRSSFDIQSIVVKAGIPQATAGQLFLTESDAGSLLIPRKGFLGNLFGRVGQQLFGKVVKKGINSTLTKAGFKAVETISGAAGPEGWVVTATTWLAEKVAEKVIPFLQRNAKYLIALPVAVAGLLIGGPLGLGLIALGVGTAAFPKGGVSAIGGGIGNATSFFFSNLFFPAVAGPLIAILIGLPILIGIILFIINSGAYVVPPETLGGPGENPYISVTKEVGPQTSYENSNLPVTVTYTITVHAKKGTLENLRFNDDCEVIKENETFKCNSTLPEEPPTIISPVEDYTFSIEQTYSGDRYKDALIINTFSVTADTADAKGTTGTGASSLIIGNPPTACYTFVGDWPSNYRSTVQAAIVYLTGHWRNFMVKACRGGQEIQLKYEVSKGNYWGWASAGGHITLYKAGLGNVTNATYILAHETGHIVSWRVPSIMQQFLDTSGLKEEGPLCSYDNTTNQYEAFAESAALYASTKTFPCINSFESKYPLHYNFAKNVIFK